MENNIKPHLYLINGPLGAGKTTFLKKLLALPEYQDARVIEN
jgi:G3E family GTPase